MSRTWDVGIVGAGVAGASLAIRLARRGISVLLIEARRFPREKVCGGCLNQRAIKLLNELGVLPDCLKAGAVPLQSLRIRQRQRDYCWHIPEMLSLRRSTLDTLLVRAAITSGAAYLDETLATVAAPAVRTEDVVRVELRHPRVAVQPAPQGMPPSQLLSARLVVVAAGLTRSPLGHRTEWPAEIVPGSRIGVQTLVPAELLERHAWSWDRELRLGNSNELRMLVGTSGYLGISRTDGDYYDFAAAIDPAAVRAEKSVGAAIERLLLESRLPSLGKLNPSAWMSTPHLTRASKSVARGRVFLLGDSMGYVEPFTGEGMSWGLAGAKYLSELMMTGLSKATLGQQPGLSLESLWNAWAARQRKRNQSVCRWVAEQVRHPARAAWLLNGLDWLPPVRNMLLRKATT